MHVHTKDTRRMEEMPIPRLILSLSLPAMMSLTLVAVYNVADAFFVSSLGTSATGVLSVVFPLMSFLQAIGFTLGMGAGSLISRHWGEGKDEAVRCYSATAFWIALFFSFLILFLGYFFTGPLLHLLGAPEDLLAPACQTARYLLAASPALILGFILSNLLRSLGHTGAALLGIATGSLLNIFLDPLFIFTLDFGVAGTGFATLVSQTTGTILLFFLFLHYKGTLSIHPKDFSFHCKDYGQILITGLPSLFRQGLAMVSSILLNHQAASFGSEALAAMGIVGKIFMIFFSVALGLGQGYQPFAGFAFGANHSCRLRKAFFFTLWFSTGIMLILSFVLYFSIPALLPWFSSSSSVLQIAAPALRSLCLIFPLLPTASLANLIYQAIGCPGRAVFLASARQGLFFIPLIIFLPPLLGLPGIQYAQAFADALTALLCLPFLIYFIRHRTCKN